MPSNTPKPTLIVRVELHNVPASKSEAVYDQLHIDMEEDDFVRFIVKDGEKYQLPSAMYRYIGPEEDALIADAYAARVALGTGYKYWTLTIKAAEPDDIDWSNLEMLED